jgi:cellulose synthase/poly-beta-1,6-N-acetylglucosamine synthase-like glycosyltransferase
VSLARQLGARVVVAEGLNIPESRNLGSSLASGDVLVQLDADTFIDEDVIGLIESVLAVSDVVGGTFRLYPYDGEWYHKAFAAFVYIALFVTSKIPAKVKPRLGGAVVFMRRDAFEAVGRYWSNPVCEDQYIAKMLAGVGRFVYVDRVVYTSARRLVKWGFLRGVFRQTFNSALLLLFGRTLLTCWEPINE